MEDSKSVDPWTWDTKVRQNDVRPAGNPNDCFYCLSPLGVDHKDHCVVIQLRRLDAAPIGEFQPIETYRDGDFVMFLFPNGEKGNGGIETAMSFKDDDGVYRVGWSHGGPNSGLDFEFIEPPCMWARLPDIPYDIIKEKYSHLIRE